MPVFDSYAEGTPCFVDLVTPDLDAARAFYGGLFGWRFSESPGDQGAYLVARIDGHVVGGLDGEAPALPDHPAYWRVHLAVDDLEAVIARATELGATVESGPVDNDGRERVSRIQDPTGARVSLWEAGSLVGTQLANEVGTPVWNELVTPDLPAATRFYADLLGVTWLPTDMGGGPYLLLQSGGRNVGGAIPLPEGPQPPHWNVYFYVDDVDATARRILALGGSVVAGPVDMPGVGRLVQVADGERGTFWAMRD